MSQKQQPTIQQAFQSGNLSVWTDEEKVIFMEQVKVYGKDWAEIQKVIPSKNVSQVKNFWGNYQKKLGLALLLPNRKQQHA